MMSLKIHICTVFAFYTTNRLIFYFGITLSFAKHKVIHSQSLGFVYVQNWMQIFGMLSKGEVRQQQQN